MKVIILGSGSYSGTPKPLCTCENCVRARLNPMYRRTRFSVYFEGILIDPSPDLHYHLERTNKRVKEVLITHAHFDHIFGIPDLQIFKEVSISSNELGIKVAKDLAKIAFGEEVPRGYSWRYNVLEFWKEYKIGKARVVHFPVPHSIEMAGGYLVEINGVRIGITGDTGPEILRDEKVIDLLEGVDLLISEMTKKESIPGVHLGVKDSIELAKKVRAEYTVFAHISHTNYPHEVLEKKVKDSGIKGKVAKDFTIIEL
ncbi:MBL fold metallo-hydrolase [Pyrococcus sp. ST04]|uniref:MBL fold metallo-hydrolase n=1 Tax=Pyrococcus sp. ST04 TaxID=1183377 RepID=UPI000260598A|nr:MBL fold metallo-hydrolase [Pyrococcus sp. ST04]AFK21819.1 putative ATP-binding protein phnp [Pyrococcus sp. ST04]